MNYHVPPYDIMFCQRLPHVRVRLASHTRGAPNVPQEAKKTLTWKAGHTSPVIAAYSDWAALVVDKAPTFRARGEPWARGHDT